VKSWTPNCELGYENMSDELKALSSQLSTALAKSFDLALQARTEESATRLARALAELEEAKRGTWQIGRNLVCYLTRAGMFGAARDVSNILVEMNILTKLIEPPWVGRPDRKERN
jgi:hypothetical protein